MRTYLQWGILFLMVGTLIFLATIFGNGTTDSPWFLFSNVLLGSGVAMLSFAHDARNKHHGIKLLPDETLFVTMNGETDGIAITANPGGLSAHSYPVPRK